MIVPPPPPPMIPPSDMDPWGDATATTPIDATQAAVWRERERRARTVRVLMMFLLMMLLMDGDEGQQRARSKHGLRGKSKKTSKLQVLEPDVFQSRQTQENKLISMVKNHERYQALVQKNGGHDVQQEVLEWAREQADQEQDQFLDSSNKGSLAAAPPMEFQNADPQEEQKVFHYPWNTTGFYRGEWIRTDKENDADDKDPQAAEASTTSATDPHHVEHEETLDAVALEVPMLERLREKKEVGVFLLPSGYKIAMRNDNNLTSTHWDEKTTDTSGKLYDAKKKTRTKDASTDTDAAPHVTLTHDKGRAAFQLYSRQIPSMNELSVVEGFVKLYDSASPGYSTRKDVLIRVRGVLINSIGRISLVSSNVHRSAMVIGGDKTADVHRRRLEEALLDPENADMEHVRDDALQLFADDGSSQEYDASLVSPEFESTELPADVSDELPDGTMELQVDEFVPQGFVVGREEESYEPHVLRDDTMPSQSNDGSSNGTEASSLADRIPLLPFSFQKSSQSERKAMELGQDDGASEAFSAGIDLKATKPATDTETVVDVPAWSDIVLPYPFVKDDKEESVRKVKTPAARRMPPREQLLEANVAACEFEVNMEVEETEWTVGAWRTLVGHRIDEAKRVNPELQRDTESDTSVAASKSTIGRSPRAQRKALQDQALVMNMVGSIHSPNCGFSATLNATALRTDWEATTSKAINYSFYMMLVCLTQIMILLRQLLHSQAQSAATRVSLLCIGWQTVVDALICLAHIYLSLAIQPLFTAFASVAFFKLLIFCVIEMKYMAIIIQARNSNNGGQTTEVLRRQVAMLHLRFYVALFGAFLLMFYVGDKYRLFYVLALYSFWVPQIVTNVITEAKTPLHTYYIYGMSVTRLVAPLYMFAVRNNFLKEVYPDSPTDPFMCQLLVAWIGIQTAVLIAQGKYGARFMIPARFLPPKFDYSRPLPTSMLPPGALDAPVPELMDESQRSPASLERKKLLSNESTSTSAPSRGRHTTAVTTRSRKSGRANRTESMTTETVEPPPCSASPQHASHECSICYDAIDVRDRHGYMLAPCDHLFHRECLVQWMDVKLVCPICRTELPTL